MILAIDFGGTRIRAARFTPQLVMEARAETLSRVTDPPEAVIGRLLDTAHAAAGHTRPTCIGIAAPGPLDAARGVILHAKTLPGWGETPLADLVSESFDGAPTAMHNDANLAALAEFGMGAAKGADPTIYLTISTGIGGGAVIGGELFTGWRGLAIEPGHMRFPLPDGSIRRLEELASGTGIAWLARQQLAVSETPSALRSHTVIDGKAVGETACAGDALALQVVREAGTWLGLGLANLAHLFNPEAIVLGGSVTRLGDLLLEPARATMRANLLDPRFDDPHLIRLAKLGDDVCLYGAAYYARQRFG